MSGDRFVTKRLLGSGGMGDVSLAYDSLLKREVAVKRLNTNVLSRASNDQLLHEAQLLAGINHPNIVQLFDIVEEDQELALIMEYVEGTTLEDCRKNGYITRAKGIDYAVQIADGLFAAHASGIIHCDLKCDNILVSETGVVKIADFGIARHLKSNLTPQLQDSGKVYRGSYIAVAPESIKFGVTDRLTDLFSYGVLLQIILTNKHPFGQLENAEQIVRNVVEGNRVNWLDEQEPESLNTLVSSLISSNRNDRKISQNQILGLLKIGSVSRSPVVDAEPTQLINSTSRSVSRGLFGWLLSMFSLGLVCLGLVVLLENPREITYSMILHTQAGDSFSTDTQAVEAFVEGLKHGLLYQNDVYEVPRIGSSAASFDDLSKSSGSNEFIHVNSVCDEQICTFDIGRMAPIDSVWSIIDSEQVKEFKNDIQSTYALAAAITERYYGETANHRLPTATTLTKYLQLKDETESGMRVSSEQLATLKMLVDDGFGYAPLRALYATALLSVFDSTGKQEYLREALTITDSAVGDWPAQKALLSKRVEALYRLGRPEHALQEVSDYKDLFGIDIVVLQIEQYLNAISGEFEKALEIEKQLLVIHPSAWRHYNLAMSLASLGQKSNALEEINRAIEMEQENNYFLSLKAAVLLLMGELQEAAVLYKQVGIEALDIDAKSNYALSLIILGKYAEAIQLLESVSENHARTPNLQLNLADAYQISGDMESARTLYRQIVKEIVEPKTDLDHVALSQALAQLGEAEQAISVVKSGLAMYELNEDIIYASAVVHALTNNALAANYEVERLISNGYSPVWFELPYFKSLCPIASFHNKFESFCND